MTSSEEGRPMALPWVRMDTHWAQNPKFLMLADDGKWRSIAAYWAALGWSGGNGQAGFVPYFAMPQVHAVKRNVSELVEARLWTPCDGGWQIHDWAEYQPTTEEHEKRSQRARDAAL